MQKLNIHLELLNEREKNTTSNNLSEVLKKIWAENDLKKSSLKNSLRLKNDTSFNSLNFEKMDSTKIFHEKIIEKKPKYIPKYKGFNEWLVMPFINSVTGPLERRGILVSPSPLACLSYL